MLDTEVPEGTASPVVRQLCKINAKVRCSKGLMVLFAVTRASHPASGQLG